MLKRTEALFWMTWSTQCPHSRDQGGLGRGNGSRKKEYIKCETSVPSNCCQLPCSPTDPGNRAVALTLVPPRRSLWHPLDYLRRLQALGGRECLPEVSQQGLLISSCFQPSAPQPAAGVPLAHLPPLVEACHGRVRASGAKGGNPI